MRILDVENKESKTYESYSIVFTEPYGFMLESESGEGMGITEQELFEILDKYFKEKF